MIGNGATNRNLKESSVYDFLWRHNIYGPETREILETICKRDKKSAKSARCLFAKKSVHELMSKMNHYDIYRKCHHDEDGPNQRFLYANFHEERMKEMGFSGLLEGPHCIDSTTIEDYFNTVDVRRALRLSLIHI
eukprot:TRINITY_DN6589_c0_g1_i6.p2 TRINITY_DN6589_c0_g1~~TRINITY_DN6589_c0_g1_i6.p2  ORF type:complete len:135 (-),score=21.16 TRINITY_DN6589_c0_g1_i6:60-464(-)